MKKTAATLFSAFMLTSSVNDAKAGDIAPQNNSRQIQSSPLPMASPDLIKKYCGGDLKAMFVEEELGALFCRSGRIQRYDADRVCASLAAEVSMSEMMLDLTPLPEPERADRENEIANFRAAMGKHCLSM